MRSILITSEVVAMAANYSNTVFTTRASSFEKPRARLLSLRTKLRNKRRLNSDYSGYVTTILSLLNTLYDLHPSNYDQIHTQSFSSFNIDLKKRIKLGSQNKTFYSYVTSAMRYDAVRDKEFLPFIKQLGLRSCVYCNASYALSIHLDKNNFGKFELDHFKPQSKYPYLCTNFYNLAPCCSNCNKYKTNNDSEFFLYTTDPTTIDHFDFKLDKHSIIKYMLSQDSDTLKIKFSARFHNGHDRLFKIQSTYDTLKDVAEELIWKSKIYNSSYLKSLEDGFDRKFLTGNFYRFLLGNYDRPSDIHKRPLSKMIQDIAKQLGIID